MTWSRRDWLRCAGVASGAALMGCGGAPARARPITAEASAEEVRRWLNEAVDQALTGPRSQGRWAAVEAMAVRHDHVAAAIDVQGASARVTRRSGALLSATDALGRHFEVSSSHLDRQSLQELVQTLTEIAAARGLPAATARARPARAGFRTAATAEPATTLPMTLPAAALQAHVAQLAQRADRHGSSRVVYRGAGVDLDAASVWYANPDRDRQQVLLRQRSAVTVVAWTGNRPLGAEIVRGTRSVDPLTGPSQSAIEEEIERVLRLTTPTAIESGPAEVVLAPSLVGEIFSAMTTAMHDPGKQFAVAAWRRRTRATASSSWQLLAAPDTIGAYAGYRWDDEGMPSRSYEILRAGQLTSDLDPPPIGQRVRIGHLGTNHPVPSHLQLVTDGDAGDVELEVLLGRVSAGFALEGGTLANVDFASDRLIAHARLARELRSGSYTGRAFAEVELTASLSQFLDAIAGWSRQREDLCRREWVDGWPQFWSASMPFLLGRADLHPRGRA
jgi:PmbA/TldA metallopeptidase C-terminal domain